MKKKALIIGLAAAMMCLTAGCGDKPEGSTAASVENSKMTEESKAEEEEKSKQEENDKSAGAEESNNTEENNSTEEGNNTEKSNETEGSNGAQDTVPAAGEIPEKQSGDESAEGEAVEELSGFVTEIEENRVKIIVAEAYDSGAESGDHTPREVDVYVEDSTIYELREISRDGNNAKSRESSFDEINKDDSLLQVIGHWKGTDFYAEKIINKMLSD